jgi:hypothetical protein
MTPSVPAPYVSGAVQIPAGAVYNLLVLIQQQLQANCPGSAVELMISADPANVGVVKIGAASAISGPLTATNYAYSLSPTSDPRIYRSVYPGSNVPLGELQVLATNASILHVEVTA